MIDDIKYSVLSTYTHSSQFTVALIRGIPLPKLKEVSFTNSNIKIFSVTFLNYLDTLICFYLSSFILLILFFIPCRRNLSTMHVQATGNGVGNRPNHFLLFTCCKGNFFSSAFCIPQGVIRIATDCVYTRKK